MRGKLFLGEAPDVSNGDFNGGPEIGSQTLGGLGEFTDGDADGFAIEVVELAGVFEQAFVAALSDGVEDRAHDVFGFRQACRAAGQEAADLFRAEDANHFLNKPTGGRDHRRYITILFRGYSTIPSAPACLRRGMIVRTVDSSRIVLTASHSLSLR